MNAEQETDLDIPLRCAIEYPISNTQWLQKRSSAIHFAQNSFAAKPFFPEP
ncbi:MAG: hypothetical protein NTV22_07275 [bacterium]|nr:hypothetical protein [bacterium]